MFCENCGKEIDKDSLFCEYCGHKNDEGIQHVSSIGPSLPVAKKKKTAKKNAKSSFSRCYNYTDDCRLFFDRCAVVRQ